jgi:glutamine synthetase
MKFTETNPNLDSEYRLKKIIRNYEKFGNVVVGVDFDFTLVDAVTNETYQDIVKILKRGQRKEIIYCIWTANDSGAYVKSKWVEAGLEFQYYNDSPINPCSRKPHFNILLDDSAGLKEALDLFVAFLDYLDTM